MLVSPELFNFLLPMHKGDALGQGLEVAPCPQAMGGRRRAWCPLARHGRAAWHTWYSSAVLQLCRFFLAWWAVHSVGGVGWMHNTHMDLIRPLGGPSAVLL